MDLDGHALLTGSVDDDERSETTHLYMDPFNGSEPISLSTLETRLRFVAPGATPAITTSYLSAATPQALTVRTAHNILASPSHYGGPPLHYINPNLATYAALFGLVIFASTPTEREPSPPQYRQNLAVLTQHFLEYFDHDIHLMETHILPLTKSAPDAHAYRNVVAQLKEMDRLSRPAKLRDDPRNKDVKFRIGQVFRHRRRGYLAVIYGWDPTCRMQDTWITMNQVDRLPNGRNQPFYNVLVDDQSTRYVAEENIELLQPSEQPADLANAFRIEIGKFFKRYDEEKGEFVSNVKHEYPDD